MDMTYSSERSFPENAKIPRYVADVPFPDHLPQYQAVESPVNGVNFSGGNVAFLGHNHAASNYQPVRAVSSQEQQMSPASRPWPSAHSNGPIPKSIPHPQNMTAVKSGIAVVIPTTPPLDYARLLLSLADDYFAAAHDEISLAALVRGDGGIQHYYGLIATGLGCLEAVLKVNSCRTSVQQGQLNIYSISDCSLGWRR